jgi:pyrophosphate--fructose-6-phosphate 1-phosphotransferase
MLGRSVDKVRTPAELSAALSAATELRLDGLVMLGGTFTNTDAAHLAEFFVQKGSNTRVVGVPCTIDGDIKSEYVETTVGFDTACRITAQLIGNLETDCNSAKKYVYITRVLGRERGHVALEVALQTQPNVLLIGEDVEARRMTLSDVVSEIANVVSSRAAAGKNYGVIMIPEGLVSFIPELRTLIDEINRSFAAGTTDVTKATAELTPWSRAVLEYLPENVRKELFLERESSGAVQLSQISTERLLQELVNNEINKRRAAGQTKAKGNNLMGFFLGYQARSALPTNFDCALGATLGRTAALLVAGGKTGYLASVRGTNKPVAEWEPLGVPLVALLTVPVAGAPIAPQATTGTSQGARPAILPAHVNVRGNDFRSFAALRDSWAASEMYISPGPVQYAGVTADGKGRAQ